MQELGFIGDWDGPFPLIDISGNLQQVGEDPTSVDNYVKKHGCRSESLRAERTIRSTTRQSPQSSTGTSLAGADTNGLRIP